MCNDFKMGMDLTSNYVKWAECVFFLRLNRVCLNLESSYLVDFNFN